MKRQTAIVLVSGGMDSALTAAYAFKKYELAFLHLNYGQLTQKRELKSFNNLANHYNVKHRLIVDIRYLKQIGGSSLTDRNIKVSKTTLSSKSSVILSPPRRTKNLTSPVILSEAKDLISPVIARSAAAKQSQIPTSYVPFRNANILSIAVSWAEVLNASRIFIGAVEEDSSGYPDCRKTFYDAFNEVIKYGTKLGSKLKIETPIITYSKKQIVQKAVRMKVPLHLTWSCYKSNTLACGECDSCALRQRGFQNAGYPDPIRYKKYKLYL